MSCCGIEFNRAGSGYRKKFYPSPFDARLRGGGTNGAVLGQKSIHDWDEEDVGAFLRGMVNVFGQNTTDSYVEIFR